MMESIEKAIQVINEQTYNIFEDKTDNESNNYLTKEDVNKILFEIYEKFIEKLNTELNELIKTLKQKQKYYNELRNLYFENEQKIINLTQKEERQRREIELLELIELFGKEELEEENVKEFIEILFGIENIPKENLEKAIEYLQKNKIYLY